MIEGAAEGTPVADAPDSPENASRREEGMGKAAAGRARAKGPRGEPGGGVASYQVCELGEFLLSLLAYFFAQLTDARRRQAQAPGGFRLTQIVPVE